MFVIALVLVFLQCMDAVICVGGVWVNIGGIREFVKTGRVPGPAIMDGAVGDAGGGTGKEGPDGKPL